MKFHSVSLIEKWQSYNEKNSKNYYYQKNYFIFKLPDLTDEEARKINDLDLSLEVGGYAYKVRDELQDMYRLIAKNRDVRMDKCKLLHDRRVRAADFKVGDFVLVLDKTPAKRGNRINLQRCKLRSQIFSHAPCNL